MPPKPLDSKSDHTWLHPLANLMANLVLHNFFIDEMVGGMFNHIDNHETHWVYAYSQN